MFCNNCTPKSRKDMGVIETRVSRRRDRDFSIAIYSPQINKKQRHLLNNPSAIATKKSSKSQT